jgi:dihydroorotase
MASVVPHSAAQFGRALIMPNLQAAGDHRGAGRRLPRAHPRRRARGLDFEPLMSLYLTDNLRPSEIARAQARGRRRGQALPGRRHHQQRCRRDRHPQDLSHAGAMQRAGMLLLVHGEVTDPRSTSSTARRCSWTRS